MSKLTIKACGYGRAYTDPNCRETSLLTIKENRKEYETPIIYNTFQTINPLAM